MQTVILLYRPEAASESHYDYHSFDPFNGIEVYAILDNPPEDLDDRLQAIAERHSGWKFHYEEYDFANHVRPELMVGR